MPLSNELKSENKSIEIFISYSHEDEMLFNGLVKHLKILERDGLISSWHNRKVQAGEEYQNIINSHLAKAKIILLLISADFIASDYCWNIEVQRAMQRHDAGEARVVPVLLRPVSNWEKAPFGDLQVLPEDGKAVTNWQNHDSAFLNIVGKIEEVIRELDPDQELLSLPEELYPGTTSTAVNLEPEWPTSKVNIDSEFYIERKNVDLKCYEAILQPGALLRIRASRQMGKTSLISRILDYAEKQGLITISLSFQEADSIFLEDLDQFLKWFCLCVGRLLGIPNQLAHYWQDPGSKSNCTIYFQNYLLTQLEKPLVLALDEVDMVFSDSRIAYDFFSLLRAWNEHAKSEEAWKKLRLIIAHSTELHPPQNLYQSPFNVGILFVLPELIRKEVLMLALKHGLSWGVTEVDRLMSLVGGHPYLIRMAFYHMVSYKNDFENFLEVAATDSGPYFAHLQQNLWTLEQDSELVTAFLHVMTATKPVRIHPMQAFKLDSMGLVKLKGNKAVVRCNLYRQYFLSHLSFNP